MQCSHAEEHDGKMTSLETSLTKAVQQYITVQQQQQQR